jgi:ABC-2 type transport system permease protein
MTPAATVWLIAGREIRERLQGRLLRVVTVLTALLVAAAVVVPSLISHSTSPTRIGLVGTTAQALAPQLDRTARAVRTPIRVEDLADVATARAELRAGRLDVALAVSGSGAHMQVKRTLPASTRALLTETLAVARLHDVLAAAGVRPATVAAALAPVPVTVSALTHPPADETARYIAAIAAALLMYVSLAMYGTAVAQGVAQEKTSRTAEVLLAAVRPSELLSGKVTGIGLCGLGQLAVAAASALVASAIVHGAGIPGSVVVMIPAFLVYFLAGFVLYAFAMAAAGAMVARQEEVQFATVPFSLLLLTGYLLVYVAAASPNATWLRIVSFFPPLTATLMPARIALGHVAPWEFAVQAVLMGAAIYGTIRLAGRIYGDAIVRGGGRLTWRAAIRLRSGRSGSASRSDRAGVSSP